MPIKIEITGESFEDLFAQLRSLIVSPGKPPAASRKPKDPVVEKTPDLSSTPEAPETSGEPEGADTPDVSAPPETGDVVTPEQMDELKLKLLAAHGSLSSAGKTAEADRVKDFPKRWVESGKFRDLEPSREIIDAGAELLAELGF